jgi:ATP adenylyltransferase
MALEKGMLWKRIQAVSNHAIAARALLSFPTRESFVEEQGVRYFVRVLESLRRKDEARQKQNSSASQGKHADPFLPPESDLVVGDIGKNHIAVLNKYNVVENHLLLVTKHFEDQTALLTLDDFESLWFCLAEYEGLGFYNGGREAGASQEHKHLQVVPLPLAPEGPRVPVEPLFPAAPLPAPVSVPAFPFLHAFGRIDRDCLASPQDAARESYRLYASLLKQVGMRQPAVSGGTMQSGPYCLLVTRTWMLLVPRSREHFEDISFNSLAYAGSFFVRNEQQLERLRTYGVMRALKAVAWSGSRSGH